ncbi:MAG: hypothetical protein AB8B52_10745 [Winogradskyella sp.]|uniref:hypothetical protein n=1 Tax=Winogradskyella sp. TaxID=1883156 RepID=UPI003858ECC5
MKSYMLLLICSLLMVSCSSDDSETDNGIISGDYFPSSLDDSWTYNVENNSTTNPEFNFMATDVVTINSATGNTFTLQVNDDTAPANGTMNSIFSTGIFTKTNSTLNYTGDLSALGALDILPESDIALTDFVLYDLNAAANTELYSTEDSFTQDLDFDGQTLPITTAYDITNTHVANLNELTVNDVTYTNVIHTEIRANLEISTVITIIIPITQAILESQDVLILNNYYAENVGLIKSDANQSFTISPTFLPFLNASGAGGEFPTSASVDNIQELESYIVSED